MCKQIITSPHLPTNFAVFDYVNINKDIDCISALVTGMKHGFHNSVIRCGLTKEEDEPGTLHTA